MYSPWNRKMVTMLNSLDGLDYQTKMLLETMCQGDFLKKDEDQGWDLFEE